MMSVFFRSLQSALRLSLLLLGLATLAQPAIAQDDENEAQPVLDNGIPTLKYRTESGYVSRIQQITKDGEPALSFPIFWQIGHGIQFGRLIMSKSKIEYVPNESKHQKEAFNVPRSELTEATLDKDGFGWWVKFRLASVRGGNRQRVAVSGKRGDDEDASSAQTEQLKFLQLSFDDFNAALQKFNLLTAGLSPLAPAAAQPAAAANAGGDMVKQGLWERFVNNRKTNPDVAYQAAKAYLQLYPDDADENAQLLRKWSAAYDKVKAGVAPN